MTLSHARSLLPSDLCVQPYRPDRDRAALAALAQWAMRFSPLVAVDEPDGLLMDITGMERLFGGEANLVNRLAEALAGLGLAARVATADTVGCAWAVARFGRGKRTVVPPGRMRQELADLPIRALRVDQAIVEALAEVGLRQVRHLLELPRAAMEERFGHELPGRLDQALGLAWEGIVPAELVEVAQVQRESAGPVRNMEAIRLAARGLLEELCEALGRQGEGARRLELVLTRLDAAPLVVPVTLSQPSRDARHLWSLLSVAMERVHLGGGVERLTLRAPQVGRLRHRQTAYLAGREEQAAAGRQLSQLLDVMVNRLGPDRVTGVQVVESHVPERSFRRRPVAAEPRGRPAGQTAMVAAERPSVLLDRPQEVQVMTVAPDGPLLWLRWGGRQRRIIACAGPERIAPQWWRTPAAPALSDPPECTRDYFRVQEQGGCWLWVYRELETGRWFLHGRWA